MKSLISLSWMQSIIAFIYLNFYQTVSNKMKGQYYFLFKSIEWIVVIDLNLFHPGKPKGPMGGGNGIMPCFIACLILCWAMRAPIRPKRSLVSTASPSPVELATCAATGPASAGICCTSLLTTTLPLIKLNWPAKNKSKI